MPEITKTTSLISLLNGFPIGTFLTDVEVSSGFLLGFFTFVSDLGSFFITFCLTTFFLISFSGSSGLSSPGLMVFLLGNLACWLIGEYLGFFVREMISFCTEGFEMSTFGGVVIFRFLEAASDWNAKDASVVSDLKSAATELFRLFFFSMLRRLPILSSLSSSSFNLKAPNFNPPGFAVLLLSFGVIISSDLASGE